MTLTGPDDTMALAEAMRLHKHHDWPHGYLSLRDDHAAPWVFDSCMEPILATLEAAGWRLVPDTQAFLDLSIEQAGSQEPERTGLDALSSTGKAQPDTTAGLSGGVSAATGTSGASLSGRSGLSDLAVVSHWMYDLRRAFGILTQLPDDEIDDFARRLIEAENRRVAPNGGPR